MTRPEPAWAVAALVVLLAVVIVAAAPRSAPRSGPDSSGFPAVAAGVSTEDATQGRTGAPIGPPPSHGSTTGPTQRAASRPAPVTVTPSPERSLATTVTAGPGKWYDDGPGLYGAMRWFFWGMTPVPARVCGDRGCVRVTIRDHMVSTTTLIDLSPAAFGIVCGPLGRGVCTVTVSR